MITRNRQESHNAERQGSEVAESRKRKTDRVPLGVRMSKLDYKGKEGKVRRVINDKWAKDPDRMQRAIDAGYTPVRKGEVDDSNLAPVPGELGDIVCRRVGKNEDGSPIIGVLMEIDEQFYQEDQDVKAEMVSRQEEQIVTGTFQSAPNDKRYIPKSGIKVNASTVAK